jgi:hypothetical protein
LDKCSPKQKIPAMAKRKGVAVGGLKATIAADTPDFNDSDVSFIATIPADSLFKRAEHGGPVPQPKYGPEDWLLYFWQEAKESWANADSEQKKTASEFFNKAFKKTTDWKTNGPVCKGPLLGNSDLSSALLRNVMDAFLHVGFEAYDVTANATDNLRRYRLRDDKKYTFLIFWRSEGFRDLEYLRKHGYTAQCNDTSPPSQSGKMVRCEEINCTQDWHPFKLEENKRRLWFRKGHTDNCWYTVVSVAESWKTAVCYPKFGQTPAMQIGPDVKKIGPAEALRKYPDKMGKVVYKSGLQETKMVTMSNVALVLVDSEVFDTNKRQREKTTGYDEKGVSCIAGKNVVATVKFLRIHHDFSDEQGFTAIPIRSQSQLKQPEGLLEAFGDLGAATDFNSRVLVAFNEALNTKPVSLRWDETGWAEVPKLKYLGVYEPVSKVILNGKTYTF